MVYSNSCVPGFNPTNAISNSRRLLIAKFFRCAKVQEIGQKRIFCFNILTLPVDYRMFFMLKRLRPYRRLIIILLLILLIKLFSTQPDWIENGYTYGIYPVSSNIMRLLTGWLPFSFGDILYAAAGIGIIVFVVQCLKSKRHKKTKLF